MMGFGWNQYGRFCGGFGGIGMMLGGLLLAALLIYGLVALVRREQSHGYSNPNARFDDRDPMRMDSPLAILDERYARGEIGDEEYARRKSELRKR